MSKHLPIILRALSIFLAITFIEMAKDFKDVGAAKLHDYLWSDWLVLLASIGATGFVALNAFFSTAFSDHMDKIHREEQGLPPKPPESIVAPKNTMNRLLPFLLILCGCSQTVMTHGIPNFAQVDAGIYRGGQPTIEGWQYLKSIGVVNVVKLNTQAEGEDDYTNFNVYESTVTLPQQIGLETMPVHFGSGFNPIGGSTFVHCEHGQDRTGLYVAIHRVKVNHWTKSSAEKEMLSHGFHKGLHGLWECWENFKP